MGKGAEAMGMAGAATGKVEAGLAAAALRV